MLTTTAKKAPTPRDPAGSPYGPLPNGPEGPAGCRPGAGRDRPRPGRAAVAGVGHAALGASRWAAVTAGPAVAVVGDASPAGLARAFAHLYLEVECGRRPAQQLARLMEPVLHVRLESCWVRLGQPQGRIRAVHAWMSGRDRIDAVVVVERGRRAGALALGLTRFAGRWHVTVAVRPEDGPLPPAPFSMPVLDEQDEYALAGVA